MALTEAWLIEKANRKLNTSGMNKATSDKTRNVIKKMAKKGFIFVLRKVTAQQRNKMRYMHKGEPNLERLLLMLKVGNLIIISV